MNLPDIASDPRLAAAIRLALDEDVGTGDVTTDALVDRAATATGEILSRAECCVAGGPVAAAVLRAVSPAVVCETIVPDGADVEKGGTILMERQRIEPLHRMREIRDEYEPVRREMAEHPPVNEYLKIVLKDTRITPEISDFLHETARAYGSEVMELSSEYSTFTGSASLSGTKEVHDKPLEALFADFYTERNNGTQPEEKDLELMAFTGEMVRAADGQTPPGEEDFRKILDFVLGQEGSRK